MENTNILLDQREMASTERLKIFEQAIGEQDDWVVCRNKTIVNANEVMPKILNDLPEREWLNILDQAKQGKEVYLFDDVIYCTLTRLIDTLQYSLELNKLLKLNEISVNRFLEFLLILPELNNLPIALNKANSNKVAILIHGIPVIETRIRSIAEPYLLPLKADVQYDVIHFIILKIIERISFRFTNLNDKQFDDMRKHLANGLAHKILDEEIHKLVKRI